MRNIAALTMISFIVIQVTRITLGAITFTIYHTGDIHSNFDGNRKGIGGVGRIVTYLKKERMENPANIYLDAGDVFTGTIWFSVHRTKIAEEFIKLLKVDAMCLGNHEFDEGIRALTNYLIGIECPVLCANADFSREPTLKPYLHPSVILNVSGIKVGVIGYINRNTAALSPIGKVNIGNEAKALLFEINKLKRQHVKVIIGLGHSGFEIDKTLAAGLADIDVIVGGHTHTYLATGEGPMPERLSTDDYPTLVINPQGHRVPIVHAFAYTYLVGKLSVTFDDEGVLTNFSGEPVLMSNEIVPDPEAVKLLEKYSKGISALKNQVLGKSRVYLNGSCRYFECNLGNLLTDAFVHYKAEHYAGPYWTDTAIAIINGGSVRQSISPPPETKDITMADLYGSIPFDNLLITAEISGSTLLSAIEHGVSSDGNTSRGEFLQFSGVHVVYDMTRQPLHRVESVKVRCAKCFIPAYERLDMGKTYSVVLNHYLMSGGDGYGMLSTEAHNITSEPVYDVDTLRDYIKYYQILEPRNEERILVKNDHRKVILMSTNFSISSSRSRIALSVFTCVIVYLYFIIKRID